MIYNVLYLECYRHFFTTDHKETPVKIPLSDLFQSKGGTILKGNDVIKDIYLPYSTKV